jgi:hypothetical protein
MTYRPAPSAGQEFSEKCSWFGFFDGKHKWADPEDNGENASGLPETTPGIAFYCRQTLRHRWRVTFPNGYVIIVPQVDIGPGPETGKGIDINASLAELAGYSPTDFPTGTIIKFTYIGDRP